MTTTASILTADQIALKNYLVAKGDEIRAWVAEDPDNRWACTPIEDPEFWAEDGIFTIEQYEHADSCGLAYDMHKDKYGFKPDYRELEAMTQSELDAYIKRLASAPSDW